MVTSNRGMRGGWSPRRSGGRDPSALQQPAPPQRDGRDSLSPAYVIPARLSERWSQQTESQPPRMRRREQRPQVHLGNLVAATTTLWAPSAMVHGYLSYRLCRPSPPPTAQDMLAK